MSTFLRVGAVLAIVGVLVGIGFGVYNAGLSAGFADAAQQVAASGDPVAVPYHYGYGPYWHGWDGFGFFGIFFWILGIILIVALVRAAFGWGRWGGPRNGNGGYGWSSRRDRLEELHRELHRTDSEATSGRASGPTAEGGRPGTA